MRVAIRGSAEESLLTELGSDTASNLARRLVPEKQAKVVAEMCFRLGGIVLGWRPGACDHDGSIASSGALVPEAAPCRQDRARRQFLGLTLLVDQRAQHQADTRPSWRASTLLA